MCFIIITPKGKGLLNYRNMYFNFKVVFFISVIGNFGACVMLVVSVILSYMKIHCSWHIVLFSHVKSKQKC